MGIIEIIYRELIRDWRSTSDCQGGTVAFSISRSKENPVITVIVDQRVPLMDLLGLLSRNMVSGGSRINYKVSEIEEKSSQIYDFHFIFHKIGIVDFISL